MNRLPLLTIALALFASGLASCTSVKTAVTRVTTPVKASLARFHAPLETPPIVEVDQARTKKTVTSLRSQSVTASRLSKTTNPSGSWKTAKSTKTSTAAQDSKKAKAEKDKALKTAKAEKRAKADALAWKRKKEALEKKALPKEKPLVRKKLDPSAPPIDEQIPSFGILPSLSPGDSTAISTLDNAELELPDDIAALPSIRSLPTRVVVPDTSTIPDYLKPLAPSPIKEE